MNTEGAAVVFVFQFEVMRVCYIGSVQPYTYFHMYTNTGGLGVPALEYPAAAGQLAEGV